MNEQSGSKTAFGAATLRAAHQLLDGEKILNDPIILSLLGDESREAIIDNEEKFFYPYAVGIRTSIVLRSRVAEDCLYEACKKGVRQYLLLGAGLDTFAYRQPAWGKDLRIIEADYVSSQNTKLELLQKAKIHVPENVSHINIDFEKDDLREVFKSVLNLNEPVFVSCLGVLVYLSKNAIDNIFRFVGSLPKGTTFVFTAKQNDNNSYIAQKAAEAGEPWISHFTPELLQETLLQNNFTETEFYTPEKLKQLYFNHIKTKLPLPQSSSIVKAIV